MSTVTRAADTVLDRTLLGYGNIGYLLRRTWWPEDPAPDALAGKVDVLVHNAGVMPAERTETAEGNELMLATLTASLRPPVTSSARPTTSARPGKPPRSAGNSGRPASG
ncbi:hypothetical protein [Amycolatopsis japonica]|uniref:hypothetical protein n=1 Tax=Amycolatopsis japonica TaxID=208439 RepID=UPI003406AD8E